MKKIKLALMLCLSLIMAQGLCSAADYYVDSGRGNDSNSGAEVSPWQTISYAMGDTSPVGPGDTVYLRGGEYRESVMVKKFGSEAGGYVTLRNYPGELPVMNGSASLTSWTPAVEDDPYLTVVVGQNSYTHPCYSNIYWTRVEASHFPTWLDEATMLEDGVHSRIACSPDQSEGYGEDPAEFRDVHEDSYGQDAYLYDTELTEETGYWDKKDGYWDSPVIRVLVYLANNGVRRSRIERYERSGANGQIVFTDVLGYNMSIGGSRKDCYRLINHPHVLDSAGEFFISAVENINGTDYRRVYYWPRSSGNLTDKIQLTSKSNAIYRRYFTASHLIIDGIKMFGYSSHVVNFFGASNDDRGSDLIIRNCQISDSVGTGIYISRYNRVTIENNHIRRCENRGALATSGDRLIMRNNDSRNNGSTNLSYYTVTNSMMIGNKVGGQRSAHANGTSCYGVDGMIENLLMANNVYYGCNSSFQNVKNVTLFGNIYYVDEAHRAITINNWTAAHGLIGNDGYFVYLNNTVYNSLHPLDGRPYGSVNLRPPNDNFAPTGAEAGPLTTWHVYNNIYHGLSGWEDEDWPNGTPRKRVYREKNIYTWYMWTQTKKYGWSLGETEQECLVHDVTYYKEATHTFQDIFVNPVYGAGDWRPREDGPAHGTGREVQSILEDLGIKDNFPEYDFRKDFVGNYWSDVPSVGAFEYDENAVPPGTQESEPEAIDVETTLLQVRNNVIKTGGNTQATIYCDLKDAGKLDIRIYNSKGKEIIILYSGELSAGRHEFTWAANKSGDGLVGSGIYMVHMKSAGYNETKKIAVIK